MHVLVCLNAPTAASSQTAMRATDGARRCLITIPWSRLIACFDARVFDGMGCMHFYYEKVQSTSRGLDCPSLQKVHRAGAKRDLQPSTTQLDQAVEQRLAPVAKPCCLHRRERHCVVHRRCCALLSFVFCSCRPSIPGRSVAVASCCNAALISSKDTCERANAGKLSYSSCLIAATDGGASVACTGAALTGTATCDM